MINAYVEISKGNCIEASTFHTTVIVTRSPKPVSTGRAKRKNISDYLNTFPRASSGWITEHTGDKHTSELRSVSIQYLNVFFE